MPVKWTTKWHSAMSKDIPRAHEGSEGRIGGIKTCACFSKWLPHGAK